jgi:hypothetical protein
MGVTPKRNVRVGAAWDEAEELALALARRQGKVRRVLNRASGEIEERGDITGYVEEALIRMNDAVRAELARGELGEAGSGGAGQLGSAGAVAVADGAAVTTSAGGVSGGLAGMVSWFEDSSG